MAKLSDEERKRILAKIKKLLALKEGAEKIGSEGEAYAAANGVHRLLTEYNLSMADVMNESGKGNGPDISQSDKISYASHFGLWKQKLMGIICQSIIAPRSKQVVIVGQEDNIAVCHQLYDYLVHAFVRLAKEHFQDYLERVEGIDGIIPMSVAKLMLGEKNVNEFFHSYYIGTNNGLAVNFESRQPTSEEKALVLSHRSAIDEYLKKLNIRERRGTVNYSGLNGNAWQEGYNDGKNINLDRQIGGEEQRKINKQ